MESNFKETIVQRVKKGLKTAEAYEKKLHSTMKEIEENATIIKNKGESASKEEDKDIIKIIQKSSYSFELLRENMNSVLGYLREYKILIGLLKIEEEFEKEELEILGVIFENNMPIFEVDNSGNVIKADNEISNMAFSAIDTALNSEGSLDKVLSSIIKQK